MGNISFNGNITITTWDRTVSSFREYPTTKAQDKLFKHVANDFGEQDTLLPIEKSHSNFLYKLVEKIIKRPVRNINNEKVFYNGGDSIVLSDKNAQLLDGTKIEIDLD